MTSKSHRVVVNAEEQYAIVARTWPVPDGWRDVGFEGSEEECIAHVDQVWTDMRPLSLREAMEMR
jgi:MbtH protein